MGEASLLSFQLLGVPFILRGEPTALLDELLVRYGGAVPTGSAAQGGVEIAIDFQDGLYEVRVGETSAHTTPHVEGAMRHLDDMLLKLVLTSRPGIQYVHAGTVAYGGRGIVLPGLARTGKSILVLSLVQAGARYLSDEILAFDGGQGAWLAFPRAIRLPEEGASHFPDLGDRMRPLGKSRMLPLHAVAPGIVCEEAPLACVVVPDWEPAETDELQPITRAEAARELEQARVVMANGRLQDPIDLSLCKTVPRTWRLRWRDPHSAASLLIDALSS